MNRARLFVALALSLATILLGGRGLAGLPEHVADRSLAPVHGFQPDAARGEVVQVRRALAKARGEPVAELPKGPQPQAERAPGETVHNVYLQRSPGSAIEKMATRLEGREPLVLSAAQFEKDSAILPKATAAPPAGKVSSRVFAGRGLIEIQLPSHTELITLELRPGVPVDRPGLEKSIGEASRRLFEGPRRPDRIEQMPDGSFQVHSGSIQVVDPRADRLRPRGDRRVVMKAPRTPRQGARHPPDEHRAPPRGASPSPRRAPPSS